MQLKDFLPQFIPWDELKEEQKNRFFFDEELPLPEAHAARISVLHGKAASEFIGEALDNVPYPYYWFGNKGDFKHFEKYPLFNVGSEESIAQVREWLFKTGVPFSTLVYLLYDAPRVVSTEWKILVRYWDAFAWSVGMAMVVVDDTTSWFCEFHHEDVITFKRY